jgi:hypothetical protein
MKTRTQRLLDNEPFIDLDNFNDEITIIPAIWEKIDEDISIYIEAKKIMKCSYCDCEGHLIHKCVDESIFNLNEYLKNLAFLDVFFPEINYLKLDFKKYLLAKIRVLCYLYKIKSCKNESKDYLDQLKYKLIKKYRGYAYRFLCKCMSNEDLYNFIENIFTFCINNKELDKQNNFTRFILFSKIGIFLKKNPDLYSRTFMIDKKYNLRNLSLFLKNNHLDKICPICYENLDKNNIIITNCNHYYCFDCFYQFMKSIYSTNYINNNCCCCRTKITILKYHNENEFNKIKKTFFVPQICKELPVG